LEKATMIIPLIAESDDVVLLFCSQIDDRNNLPVSYDYDYIFPRLCTPSQ